VKRRLILMGVLLVLAVAAASCGAQASLAGDYAGVVNGIRSEGAEVTPAGGVSQEFLSAKGQAITVNGEQVQVFEYADESAVEADASKVSPDGGTVGTTMITWVARPHFFRSGKVIVLYVGDDVSVLKVLETVLGPQFAGR